MKETANPTGKGVVGLGTMQDIDNARQAPPGWVLTKDPQGRPVMIPAPQAPAGQDDTAAKLQRAAAEMAKKAMPKKAQGKPEKPMTVEELERQVKDRNAGYQKSAPATQAAHERDASANPYELTSQKEPEQPGGWDTFEPNDTVPGALTEEEMARFYGR